MRAVDSEQGSVTANGRRTIEFSVTGMTCGNCARHVVEAIQGIPGVHSASVSLESNAASVRWLPGAELKPEAVVDAVREAGFEANLKETGTPDEGHAVLAGWRLNLWVGLTGTIPLMLGDWVFRWGVEPWFQWLGFGLASAVQLVAGARFYRGAWQQLKTGSSSMDTLVALGSSTAYGYSAWALLSGRGGHLYFMEAAAIITLISLGHWLESRVAVRASGALRQLLDLAPTIARRIQSDGTEMEVSAASLAPGDRVTLRPGDRVPTDGEVESGESAADESMLTGESIPVDKARGSAVYAGTVNVNGRLVVSVTATGEDTALAQIIAAVQRAQTSRANIQRLADRVSNVFVPAVILIALGAGLWWALAPESARSAHDLLAPFLWGAHPGEAGLATAFVVVSAVLIIACPCAMGLATPAAIMAGSNAAAERGILIRDAVALEKAGVVSVVLFDKTGTVTSGKAVVAKTWTANQNRPGSNPVELAASLAAHSSHPISVAIAALGSTAVQPQRWEELRGAGVQGIFPGAVTPEQPVAEPLVRLGSIAWLRECGVGLEEGLSFVEEWTKQGATVVGLAAERALLALFAIRDTLKPGVQDIVRWLEMTGLKTYLVTGDNRLTAASIAKQAGIRADRVFAEIRPEAKAILVKDLQEKGERVAFVGDGINDAPALEQADLGIAVSRASDVAKEAADIILLHTDIGAVPESIGLARATLRTIKQNLFWAFFYNSVGIPLAALGFMSPVLCAAAMGLSDLVVIGNALRLRRWRPRRG